MRRRRGGGCRDIEGFRRGFLSRGQWQRQAQQGEGGEAAAKKRSPGDFALWKNAKPGEPSWESPWGGGRPGWHIECSAMSRRLLGETFDIHTGGIDNIFPHHVDEIAQSEGATGQPFVRYWMHVAHLMVDGEKMAKSKGNFYTLKDLLEKGYDPRAIRAALISVHYRQPMNLTLEGIDEAAKNLARVHELLRKVGGDASVSDRPEVALAAERDGRPQRAERFCFQLSRP